MPSCYPGLALEHKVTYHMLPPSYGWMPTPSAALWIYAFETLGCFFYSNSIQFITMIHPTHHLPASLFSLAAGQHASTAAGAVPRGSTQSAARHPQEGRKPFRGSCRCLWPGRLSRRRCRRGDSKTDSCGGLFCNVVQLHCGISAVEMSGSVEAADIFGS